MIYTLPDVRHGYNGFDALVSLYQSAKNCRFENIEIDMQETTWFDADMCASFGAILHRLNVHYHNNIKLSNVPLKQQQIFSRNGFLSHYGYDRVPDNWGTTIPYQIFDAKDERFFGSYIECNLMNRSEIPAMSDRLRKKFQRSIFEIFSNAVLHSGTKLGIFSCGQFFPNRNHLDFSIADLGVGIKNNIKNTLGLDLDSEGAINWATSGRNTTKKNGIPGGLGLKLLIEFVDLNDGKIQIVSDSGYWKRSKKKTETKKLNGVFPGTVINLEINTNDLQSYKFANEIDESDIF